MDKFFNPKSVAVIGVSERETNMARQIVINMDDYGYEGRLHLVGPRGGQFAGRPIHKAMADLPEVPELAVVFTPAKVVPAVFEELAELGVKRAVVETGGFSELEQGRGDLEKRIKEIAQANDIRFIGPNCIGVVNVPGKVAVPFAHVRAGVKSGGLSIIAQSGGIALTYFHGAYESGIGLAKFASVGNKLNVGERDLLAYYLDDPETEVVLMYLESIVDGREMCELIAASDKPVVVHKSNTSALSNKIAQSHTAALANDDAVVDAALKQAGAIRITRVSEALDTIKALTLPRPRGRRLGIISRSGGHAVVSADAAAREGMEMPPLPQELLDGIRQSSRAAVINLQNPLDLGDLFDFNLYTDIVRGALSTPAIDGVVMVHAYRGEDAPDSRKFMGKVHELVKEHDKPVAMVALVDAEEHVVLREVTDLPMFPMAEEAIAALAKAARLSQRRGLAAPQGVKLDQKALDTAAGLAAPDGWLELPEALFMAASAGVPVAPFKVAESPLEAARAAQELGFPVVVKAVGADVSHKTEAGGVALGLEQPSEVEAAASDMIDRLGCQRVVVMRQIDTSEAREMILGVKRDPSFGPLLLLGLGGVTAEALKDVSLRLAPLDHTEAEAMRAELRGAALLGQFRGLPAVDGAALNEAVVRIGLLAQAMPQLLELDLNPLLVGPGGVVAVDARARLIR